MMQTAIPPTISEMIKSLRIHHSMMVTADMEIKSIEFHHLALAK